MIISQNKVVIATLFILVFAGLTIQSIPLSVAKRDPQIAEFSSYAIGRGFVIWNGTIGTSAEYFENSLWGSVSFSGSALVEEVPDLKKWYGATERESIQCDGILDAEWTHNGASYSLMIQLYSKKKTSGLFNPQSDCFTVPVFFVPDPPPRAEFMSYEGVLTGIDPEPRTISGWAALTVYIHIDITRLVVIFDLEVEDTSIPVTIAWFNQDFAGLIYRARVLDHTVTLKKD